MGEMGVWVEKEKTLLQKKELNPEIWGKGVCDIWEKWVCLGGETKYLLVLLPFRPGHVDASSRLAGGVCRELELQKQN